MRKKTDLEAVKAVALSLLYIDIYPTKFAPMIVQHPFTETATFPVEVDGELQMINLLEDEEALEDWQTTKKVEIKQAENAIQIYIMFTKPYIFAFLKFAKPYLSKEDLSRILGDAWSRVEQSNMDNNLSKVQLVALFKKCDPKLLMAEEEYKAFQEFPPVLTVYRGVTDYNKKQIKALSWTLDEKKAEWFATRYGEKGKVYKAKIQKEHTYAYFTNRSEAEVIVDPKYLEDIGVYKDFKEE